MSSRSAGIRSASSSRGRSNGFISASYERALAAAPINTSRLGVAPTPPSVLLWRRARNSDLQKHECRVVIWPGRRPPLAHRRFGRDLKPRHDSAAPSGPPAETVSPTGQSKDASDATVVLRAWGRSHFAQSPQPSVSNRQSATVSTQLRSKRSTQQMQRGRASSSENSVQYSV